MNYNLEKAARLLTTASNIESISFYTLNTARERTNPNKGPSLDCRLHGFPELSDAQHTQLANDLNEAIQPILAEYRNVVLAKARSIIMGEVK